MEKSLKMILNPILIPVKPESKLYNIQGNFCFDGATRAIYLFINGVKYFISSDNVPELIFDSLIIGSHKIPNNVNDKKGIIDNTVNFTNNYSNIALLDDSVMIMGGNNTCTDQVTNSILLGFDTNFNSYNSVILNNQFSNIHNIIDSILAIDNSNIFNSDHCVISGQFLDSNLQTSNSVMTGFQNSMEGTIFSGLFGRNSNISGGESIINIGNINNFSCNTPSVSNITIGNDNSYNNLYTYNNNIILGSNNNFSNSSSNSFLLGSNLTNIPPFNDVVAIGNGTASSSSIFYGGTPGKITSPIPASVLSIFSNNLILGSNDDSSTEFSGGISYPTKTLTLNGGDEYFVSISDYNLFIQNTSIIDGVDIYLPLMASLRIGQTWRIVNNSPFLPPLTHIIFIHTLDAGMNIYSNGLILNAQLFSGGVYDFVYDGIVFQLIAKV